MSRESLRGNSIFQRSRWSTSRAAPPPVRPSMSGKVNSWNNAAMESFCATLKTELVNHAHYATHEQARASIFEYIEVFYNRKRLHSLLGHLSPETFETGLN